MDVRAFGSYYGFNALLPYASGLALSVSGQSYNFPASRGVLINSAGTSQTLQVLFSDSPTVPVTLASLNGDSILPISIVGISGARTTLSGVVVLY